MLTLYCNNATGHTKGGVSARSATCRLPSALSGSSQLRAASPFLRLYPRALFAMLGSEIDGCAGIEMTGYLIRPRCVQLSDTLCYVASMEEKC